MIITQKEDYASFNDGRLDGGLREDSAGRRVGPLVFYDADLENKMVKISSSAGKMVKEVFELPGGRRFHFLDPDGNASAIWSDKSFVCGSWVTSPCFQSK